MERLADGRREPRRDHAISRPSQIPAHGSKPGWRADDWSGARQLPSVRFGQASWRLLLRRIFRSDAPCSDAAKSYKRTSTSGVLFGSRTRGDARSDSDVDLLIIRDTDQPVYRRAIPAYRALSGMGILKDII